MNKCISDGKKKCKCGYKECERLKNMSDQEILDLL